jgi:hypothetical protein
MLTGIITYDLQLYFDPALGFLGKKRRKRGVTTRMEGKNK